MYVDELTRETLPWYFLADDRRNFLVDCNARDQMLQTSDTLHHHLIQRVPGSRPSPQCRPGRKCRRKEYCVVSRRFRRKVADYHGLPISIVSPPHSQPQHLYQQLQRKPRERQEHKKARRHCDFRKARRERRRKEHLHQAKERH